MNNFLLSVTNISNNNAPLQHPLALAERADIHKSCKSLETLLNILNDYCEVATAIVTLQRKLAKALRDTAGSKITNETAGNALNASASIFEALVEVDSKFLKIADKEYDAISTEVKRWFKKLAKEEKAHDERIANANAKIKQAGLNFEKKSKKKAADAQDEHSRYIHLISTLGPEITQEKHNHSLQVTQRHTGIIYSVAGCLSRIADTEWARSCENVRRFAPTIGTLGEWRSLCEGGWTKEIPGDLANIDDKTEDKLPLNTIQEKTELEEEVEAGKRDQRFNQRQPQAPRDGQTHDGVPSSGYERPDGELSMRTNRLPLQHLNSTPHEEETSSSSPSYPSRAQPSISENSPIIPGHSQGPVNMASPPASSDPTPPRQAPGLQAVSTQSQGQGISTERGREALATMNSNTLKPLSPTPYHPQTQTRDPSPMSEREGLFSDPATGSVRSLSAFPIPPTHFPLPPPRTRESPAHTSNRQSDNVIKEGREVQTYAAKERQSESPLPMEYPEERRRENVNVLSFLPQQTSQRQSGEGSEREHRIERQHSNLGLDVIRYSSTSTSSIPSGISLPAPIDLIHRGDLGPENFDKVPHAITEKEEFRARDFGVLRRENGDGATSRARGGVPTPLNAPVDFPSAPIPSQRRDVHVERTDTGNSTSGSIVAVMKSRYSNTSGSRSPPPRIGDLPRLHTSVTQIASRYQSSPPQASMSPAVAHSSVGSITEIGELREHHLPTAKPTFLRTSTKSPPPPMGRNTSLPSTQEKIVLRQHHISSLSLTPTTSPRLLPTPGTPVLSGMRVSLDEAEDRLHRRRVDAREKELREREQEIMLREKELERDRARLLTLRDGLASSSPSANESEHDNHSPGEIRDPAVGSPTGQLQPRPRERRISFRRSRQDSHPKTPQMRSEQLLHPSKSSSQGNLIPSVSSPNLRERHQSQHSLSSPPTSYMPSSQDPGSSASSALGSGNLSHPSQSTGSSPSQEKKVGWMRRLSMPVGNALPFTLDSSKRYANNSTSSTASSVSANISSPKVGVRHLGAGIVGGKGITTDERRLSTSVALGLGSLDGRGREREFGFEKSLQQQEEQDRGRFGGLGLGLGGKSYGGSRSATNLTLGLGRSK